MPHKISQKISLTTIDVAVDLPMDKTFTYSLPADLSNQVEVGKRVLVPFGKRVVTGFCIGFKENPDVKGIKDIIDVLDEEPIFDEGRLRFFQWVASYYFANIGEVLSLICPGGANIKSRRCFFRTVEGEIPDVCGIDKEILEAITKKDSAPLASLLKIFKGKSIYSAINRLKHAGLVKEELKIMGRVKARKDKKIRDPLKDIIPQAALHKPNEEQERAIAAISQGLKNKTFSPYLLYGVTGSGKTFVYLKALEQAALLGKQAIFLAPEISLTAQPVKYLTAMFPGRVAVLHSGLSDGERYDEWDRIKQGKADVVVGARSALFAPLKNIGLIIVDEEHESSYKQEEGIKYHARDLSLMMGKMLGLTVVLGSATPSMETFYNARNGRITPLQLTKRIEDRPMPTIELVDMRRDRGQGKDKNISDKLQNLMFKNHERGRQTILFLNRRGFSNFLICSDCGHSFQCLNCNVSLTLHRGAGLLKCHYCDMSMPIPDICPKCRSCHIKPIGMGTEQLEEEARKALHGARVVRMDRDTTTKKRAHQKILDAVDKGDVDVLVGTQMVAKGHHFPDVTLVGIVSADTSINIPDFRSSERTFQLITQAAGRAGRGNVPGEVIVQTFNPEHFCLKWAAEQNYEAFFEEELSNREGLFYPPFSRLALIRFEGNKEADVEAVAKKAKRVAGSLLENGFKKLVPEGFNRGSVAVFGPAPAFFSKLKGKYRWQMLLKGKNVKPLHEFTASILKCLEKKHDRVKIVVDIDPANTV